jgi:glycerol-3-phosphate acyltransferase PlsY
VFRTLGVEPAILTAFIDVMKGYAVPRLARHFGSGRDLTGALALTAMVARVAVLGGRGAATGAGGAFAIDEPTAAVAAIPALAGIIARRDLAPAVALTAITFVPVRWALTRSWRASLWGLLLCGMGAYARLRGDALIVPAHLTARLAWRRLFCDRDEPRRRPG